MTQPRTPRKWHESAAEVVSLLVFVAFLTSPCWAAVLITTLIVGSWR